jgi:protein TonB
MNFRFPEWTAEQGDLALAGSHRAAPAPSLRASIGGSRTLLQDKPRRWQAMAISLLAHGVIIGLIMWATLQVVKPPPPEAKPIMISIARADPAPPKPKPEPLKLEAAPQPLKMMPEPNISAPPPVQQTVQAAPPAPAPTPPQPVVTKTAEQPEVAPPRFDADYLKNPAPVYPNMSRRLRETGIVQLRVRVSDTGQPLEVLLSKSCGYSRLDEAALQAVRKWRFQAASRAGVPLEAWVIVPVEFSLTHG